ncbi:dual specificity protein phosphatase 22-B [Chrysoperla carnea]|uniref:dual specificity protein phosphatase 22-B n=1 Tax=Chrysoperla carnea TaxID=189513 RepID=UPI001D082924|nr:dual specificity protein phosphatase 22-B [Chrysoperla carnea]
MRVLPGLYVGNYRDSKDAAQLDKYRITHIVAIHDTARRLHSDKHYLCVLASDTPEQNLTQYFPLCNDFIHAARLRDGNVLIHCLAGMSRSVTVAVAYIMSVTSLSWKEALKVVRAGRAVANPNLGFQRQLQDFESNRLFDERRRLKERFPSLALVANDEEQCSIMLDSYDRLLLARTICEGKCPLGVPCPTGVCRGRGRSTSTTSSSQRRRKSNQRGTSADISRSPSICSTSSVNRPRSSPAGFHSYTGSAPPSRSSSRVELHMAGCSAPCTPQPSPPVSPQHFPRRSEALQRVNSASNT